MRGAQHAVFWDMARGKIYTNRKKTISTGKEKPAKPSVKSKKEKKAEKAKAEEERARKGADYFDPKTGVVFSTRPEDVDIQCMESTVANYLKSKGAIGNPHDYFTTAIHLGTPAYHKPQPSSPPPTVEYITSVGEQEEEEAKKKKKTKNKKMEPVGISAIPEVPVTFWKEVKDQTSNRVYYWNPETNVTSWTLPPNAVIASDEAEKSDKIRDPEDEDEIPLGAKPQAQTQAQSGKESAEAKQNEGEVTEATKETVVEVNGHDEANKKESSNKKTVLQKQGKIKSGSPVAAGIKSSAKNHQPASSMIFMSVSDISGTGSVLAGSIASGKQESHTLRLQVSSMSDEVNRKLSYLHVSSNKMSDLQRLNVQLETRLSDWNEGALTSKYVLAKLKEADRKIQSSIQRELPHEWQCSWDRASCRYYFVNHVTGEKLWEFPTVSSSSPQSSQDLVDDGEEEEEEEEEEMDEEDDDDEQEVMEPEAPPIIPDGLPTPPTAPQEDESVDEPAVPTTITTSNIECKEEEPLPPTADVSQAHVPEPPVQYAIVPQPSMPPVSQLPIQPPVVQSSLASLQQYSEASADEEQQPVKVEVGGFGFFGPKKDLPPQPEVFGTTEVQDQGAEDMDLDDSSPEVERPIITREEEPQSSIPLGIMSPPQSNEGTPQPPDAPPQLPEAPPQPFEAPPQPSEAPPQPSEAPPQPFEAPPQPSEAPPQPFEVPPQPSETPPQPSEPLPQVPNLPVSLYDADLPPTKDQQEVVPDGASPPEEESTVQVLELADEEAKIRARLLEKIKPKEDESSQEVKPEEMQEKMMEEEEKVEDAKLHVQEQQPAEAVEKGKSDKEDEKDKSSSPEEKKPKKDRYHDDRKRYDDDRDSYKSRRSKRHRDDYSDSDSDDYRSSSHKKHRRHRSRTPERYSRDYYSRSSKSSRSRRYSDDSDDDHYSSRRDRHRSHSRDRYRSSKKKKKDKKSRHRRHSSSSEDDRSSRHESSRSKGKFRDRDTKPRDTSLKTTPPPMEKTFVPARFKPKKPHGDENGQQMLTPTQMEIMHNIASATGVYPVTYPIDAQYANYAYYDPNVVATQMVTTPTTTGVMYSEPPPPPPPKPEQAEEKQSGSNDAVNQATSSEVGGAQPESRAEAAVETVSEPVQEKHAPVVMEKSDNKMDSEVTAVEKAAPESEVVKETPSDSDKIESDKVADPPTEAPPESEVVAMDTESSTEAPSEQDVPSKQADDAPEATSMDVVASPPAPPTSDAQATSTESQAPPPPDNSTAVTTTTSNPPVASQPRDTTPPLQDTNNYTYSAPSTTYAYQYTDPNQAYAAYAQAQAYYANPYSTAGAVYDPNQYAAAMNYYQAAYQAAFNAGYGAYFQQSGSNGTQKK